MLSIGCVNKEQTLLLPIDPFLAILTHCFNYSEQKSSTKITRGMDFI